MFDGEFSGSAYDGYLRHVDPTGERVEVTRASYDFSDDLRHFQWGAQVGAQWRAYKHLAVYADLEWGFNNIFPSDLRASRCALSHLCQRRLYVHLLTAKFISSHH